MKQPELHNQVVLITGAGRAPAPEIAQALVQCGAIVAANDLSPALIEPLVENARASAGQLKAYIADATRGMPLRAMLDEILDDWGKIDVLINNPRIRPQTPFLEIDEWDWQRTMEMNLNGPFLITRLVARLMREQGSGTILNIVDANPEILEADGHAAYSASQQGLQALSQASARALIAYNIRVHTLCPDETAFAGSPNSPEGIHTSRTGSVMARLAAFLCGPAAANLNSQCFRIDAMHVSPQPDPSWTGTTTLSTGPQE